VADLLDLFADSASLGADVRAQRNAVYGDGLFPAAYKDIPRCKSGGAPLHEEAVVVDVEIVHCKIRTAGPPRNFRRLPGAPPLVIVDAEVVGDVPKTCR